MRRRTLLPGGGPAVVLAAAGVVGRRAIPSVPPAAAAPRSASVARETAYVERWWRLANPAYGGFGGTDRVHFTSQALHAHGWPMTADGGTSTVLGRRAATRTWVGSTALMRWLATRPDLATAVDDGHRDHTAVVAGVHHEGGRTVVEVAEHSPAGLHDSVDRLTADHGGRGVIHYWHLRA